LQVSASDPTGAFGFITNAGAAEVTGLELEVNSYLTDHLQAGFGLSWLPQKELTQDQIKTVDIGGTQVTLFAPGRKGDQIPRIPEIQLNGSVQYNYDLQPLPEWQGWLRADWSYRSSSHTELQSFAAGNANDRTQKGYGLVNLRAGFDNAAWKTEIALYIDNVADEQGDVFIQANSGEPTYKITNRPRTIGIQFSKKF
jgi:outer membrane receptor protein involved in Fe transport